MSRVAVLGLGAMGSRIAAQLLSAGHEVVVWNRTPAKAEPLVEVGAVPAASPAEAARGVELVITMLADAEALRAVVGGPEGLAAGLEPGTTVIDMSTVGTAAVEWLEAALPPGTPLLDAPVLGSLPEAESGSLTIFVGGPEELVQQWTPLLGALGTVVHVGPLGAGQAAKLVANTTLFEAVGVLGESLALAGPARAPREVAYEVIAATPLAGQAERRRGAIESGEFPTRFRLSLARKDTDLVADAATGADLRLFEVTRERLLEAERDGLGDADYSAVLGPGSSRRAGRPRSAPASPGRRRRWRSAPRASAGGRRRSRAASGRGRRRRPAPRRPSRAPRASGAAPRTPGSTRASPP